MEWKVVGLCAALAAATVHAGECRDDVEQRLSVLHDTFDEQARGTYIWSWSWAALYAAGAVAQFAVAASMRGTNPSRSDLLFGGAASVFGATGLVFLPMRMVRPLATLRWDDPDRCRLLAAAEAARASTERNLALGSGWLAHGGNVLFNIAIGLVLGIGFNHWQSGGITAAVGIAVGEINLLSIPHPLKRAGEAGAVRVVPMTSRDLQGVGLVVSF